MKTFEEKLSENKPSLVLFVHANEQDKDTLEQLADGIRVQYGDRVNVMRVDASVDHRLKNLYNVHTYPTWILFKKGEELMRESGNKTVGDLSRMIDRAFD